MKKLESQGMTFVIEQDTLQLCLSDSEAFLFEVQLSLTNDINDMIDIYQCNNAPSTLFNLWTFYFKFVPSKWYQEVNERKQKVQRNFMFCRSVTFV